MRVIEVMSRKMHTRQCVGILLGRNSYKRHEEESKDSNFNSNES